jgi:hypothetical protein
MIKKKAVKVPTKKTSNYKDFSFDNFLKMPTMNIIKEPTKKAVKKPVKVPTNKPKLNNKLNNRLDFLGFSLERQKDNPKAWVYKGENLKIAAMSFKDEIKYWASYDLCIQSSTEIFLYVETESVYKTPEQALEALSKNLQTLQNEFNNYFTGMRVYD